MDSLKNEDALKQHLQTLKQYDYGFENLVFEGGGAKISAYVGVVKVGSINYFSPKILGGVHLHNCTIYICTNN